MTMLQPDDYRLKLITLLTQTGQTVLDPYCQGGEALQAALTLERRFIGITATTTQCEALKAYVGTSVLSGTIELFDAEYRPNSLDRIPQASVDLILSDIPRFEVKNASLSYAQHVAALSATLQTALSCLKPHAYVAWVVTDQRFQGRYYACHADVMQLFEKAGLSVQGLINVVADRGALRAYGYPSTYVPNIINRFVVIGRYGLAA